MPPTLSPDEIQALLAYARDKFEDERYAFAPALRPVRDALVVAHLGLRFAYGSLKDGLDVIGLGLIALGLSPWIARVVESFKFGSLELRFVRQQLEQQEQEIDALQFLFTNFLTFWELHHLTALVNHTEFTVRKDQPHLDALARELRRLRELNLIGTYPDKGVTIMLDDPRPEKSLHEFFYATDRGRNYLKVRAEMGLEALTAP